MLLVGDIGGTKAILALAHPERPLEVTDKVTLASADHASAAELVAAYAKDRGPIEAACIGLPGPVIDDAVKATNLPWVIRRADLTAAVGGAPVFLLNDLEAVGWALSVLPPERFAVLQDGRAQAAGNAAIIAAGTGLGQAGLVWDGRGHVPFASEGGHATFAPRTSREIRLREYLTPRFGHVSCERVVSGWGLVNIFEFLRDEEGMAVPPDLAAALADEARNDPALISGAALAAEAPIAVAALEYFVDAYGAEAGNLALKLKATAGVYLAGGIAPKVLPKLRDGRFVAAFTDKGRFSDLLRDVPVRVVLDPAAALYGAARYAAERRAA